MSKLGGKIECRSVSAKCNNFHRTIIFQGVLKLNRLTADYKRRNVTLEESFLTVNNI